MQTLREKCKLFITLCRGVSHPIKTRGHCHARIFDRADSFLFSDYRHLAGVAGRGVLRAACLPAKSGGAGCRHRLRHLPVERCDGGSPAGRTFKSPLQPLFPHCLAAVPPHQKGFCRRAGGLRKPCRQSAGAGRGGGSCRNPGGAGVSEKRSRPADCLRREHSGHPAQHRFAAADPDHRGHAAPAGRLG